MWEALEIALGRHVALKILRPSYDAAWNEGERFRREAEAAGRLHHHAVVQVYARGEVDGVPYIAEELVPDSVDLEQTCARWVREAPPADAVRRSAEWIADIADALVLAHRQGILHRDLKPANLLVSARNQVKLLDFGLARVSGDPSLSQTGEMAGTPYFMCPEQVRSGSFPQDPRCDVYGLGATLYQLLTLRRPFDGDTTEQVFHHILHLEAPPPHRVQPRVPRDLSRICMKAMEKDPAHRYRDMESMSADLQRFLRHEPVRARPPGPWLRLLKWRRRRPAAFVASAATALLAAVLIVTSNWIHDSGAARRLVESDLARAQHERYAILVRAAGEAIAGFRFEDARELLSICEPRQRDWSWRSLQRALQRHLYTLHPAGGPRTLSAAMHPEGKFVAAGFGDGNVQVWSTGDGLSQRRLGEFEHGVFSVAFSADGHWLAAGGDDATVRVWDTEGWRPLLDYRGHQYGVGSVAFGADGRWAVSCDDGGEVHRWDRNSGEQLAQAQVPARAVVVAVAADGATVAVADGGGKIWLLDAEDLQPRCGPLPGHKEMVYDLAFLDGGRVLASASSDRSLRFWDVDEGRALAAWQDFPSALNSVCAGPDDRLIAVGDKDGAVILLDRERRVVDSWPCHFAFNNVVRIHAGRALLVSGGDDGGLHLWDLRTHPLSLPIVEERPDSTVNTDHPGDARATSGPGRDRSSLGFNFSGGHVYDVLWESEASVWVRHENGLDHYQLHAAAGQRRSARLLSQVALRGSGRLATARDRVLTWHDGGLLVAPRAGTGRGGLEIEMDTHDLACVVVHPTESLLATGHHDGSVRLWDIHSGLELRAWQTGLGALHQVEFLPDGDWLRTTGKNGQGRDWGTPSSPWPEPVPR